MIVYLHADHNEKITPIKIADALIENKYLRTVDLEEIGEHLLIYCKYKKVEHDRQKETYRRHS